MSRTIFISIIFFLFSLRIFGQQEKEELKKMHAVYAAAKTFSMDISLQLFSNSSDINGNNKVEEGKVYKDDNKYYSEMLGRITLVNDHCCLLIDKSQKLLVYSEPEKSDEKNTSLDNLSFPDSSVFKGAKMKFISQTSEVNIIELKYDKDVLYDKIEISIDPKTHYLTHVVYYYANVNGKSPVYSKSEITYNNIRIGEPVNSSFFSEKKFVTVTKDKVIPLANYVSYEVIDQRRYNNYSIKPH